MNIRTRTKTTLIGIAASLLGAGSLLAQSANDDAIRVHSGGSAIGGLIPLIIGILIIAGMWKVFAKAGQPGWASIIPIYNTYILCKVAGRPGWWVILFFVPLVNFIIAIIVIIEVAKNFGKGVAYGLGLLFLGFIFFPMLGFGSATYKGTAA